MGKRVLCFGDSNTWGYDPRTQGRYPREVRWTGVLQQSLGAEYEVIEEGLNGRTTIFEYKARFGKCGLTYLRPCMDSHFPLDYVILNLGPNDTKVEFGQTPEAIAAGLEQLVETILGNGLERPSPGVKLIVVAPTFVRDAYLNGYVDMLGAEAKTRKLPALYQKIAERHGARFVDLSTVTEPSRADGVHLEPETHQKIAALLSAAIREIGRVSTLP